MANNPATETRPKRYQFWLTPEASEVLDGLSTEKSDFVNRAIVEYWAVTQGEKVPLLGEAAIKKLSKLIVAEMKKV